MRYLVRAKLKNEKAAELLIKIKQETLGQGSVAFGEYVKNMREARRLEDGTVCWIEVCFCHIPLNEEWAYWEAFFDEILTEEAQDRARCSDSNGKRSRACLDCGCTAELEKKMEKWGEPFVEWLDGSLTGEG